MELEEYLDPVRQVLNAHRVYLSDRPWRDRGELELLVLAYQRLANVTEAIQNFNQQYEEALTKLAKQAHHYQVQAAEVPNLIHELNKASGLNKKHADRLRLTRAKLKVANDKLDRQWTALNKLGEMFVEGCEQVLATLEEGDKDA